MPHLGIYFCVRQFRRVGGRGEAVPWKSQSRKGKQRREEELAEHRARLRAAEEARPQAPLLQIPRNLGRNSCLHLRRKQAGEEAGFGSLRKS